MPRALFVALSVATLATILGTLPVRAATTVNWSDGTSDWITAANWTNSGSGHTIPAAGDTVNIGPFGDGVARTITYDYTGVAVTLAQLTVDLTGAGATTTTLSMSANNLTSSIEYVGYTAGGGRGTFSQSGGTNTIAAGTGYLDVGVFGGATGTYNLSNTGALVANTPEYVGDIGVGIFMQTGGSNTINGSGNNLFLGYNSAGNGSTSGTYTLSAGTLTVNGSGTGGNEYVGYNHSGTVNQSGGTNTANVVFLGDAAGSSGMYTLSGGTLSTGFEYVGNSGSALFTQNAGTNTTSALTIGFSSGPSAVYNLSGTGALSTTEEIIGDVGTSNSLNQTGGSHSVGDELDLGLNTGSSGMYAISGGTGSASSIYLGGSSAGATGSGILNLSGSGVLTTGLLTIYNTTGSMVNLSGGTLNTPSINVNGVPSKFNWTGGELNITANVTWNPSAAGTSTGFIFGSSLTLGSTQTLMVTGNETLGGSGAFALTLNSGSTHNVTGNLTLSPTGTITQNPGSTLNAATFTQAGGTVNGTLQNQGNFVYQSGLFNGRLLNQGTVSLGPSFTAGNGVENDTSVILAIGQTLTLNGAGLDNEGSFTVAGIVNGAGPLTNNGLLGGTGTLGGSGGLTNNAELSISNGNLTLSNAGANSNAGTVDIAAGLQLKLTGGALTNSGALNLSGGIVAGTATLNNSALGTISGHGTISTPLSNTGLLVVDAGILNITQAFANNGQISLTSDSATLATTGTLTNNGGALISGTGRITNDFTNAATGTVRATGSDWLVFTGGTNTNNGNFDLVGGTIEFRQAFTNAAGAAVSGFGSLITSSAAPGGLGIINNGVMQFSGGNTAIRGDVNNNASGQILTAGGSVTSFFDDVHSDGSIFTNAGARTVFFGGYSGAGTLPGTGTNEFVGDTRPGNSPASVQIGGNAVFDTPAHLFVEIGGTTPGTQYDQLHVAGQLSLGGTLQVSLINGFSPAGGTSTSFDILDWGTLSGRFSSIELPALTAPLGWDVSQLYSTGVITATAYLKGDINRDGQVTVADIQALMSALTNVSQYRTNAGLINPQLFSEVVDVNGDGVINNLDLQSLVSLVANNESGNSALTAVPEPASIVLLGIGAMAVASCRRARSTVAKWADELWRPL